LAIAEGPYQRNRSQQEQARIQPRTGTVVLLDVVLEAAEKKACSKHEERVGHDRADHRALDEAVLPGMKSRGCDDQFRKIAQCRIQQPAHRVSGLFGNRFGGVT
jgi:hypothetical protein